MTAARCEVLPGPGSVARRRECLLWASESVPAAAWDTLVACLGLGPGAPASAAVLRGLTSSLLPDLPDAAFALLISDGSAGFVLRHGDVEVRVDEQPLSGDPVTNLTPGATVLLGGSSAVQGAATQAPTYRHDLTGGAVPGGALRWTAVPRAEAAAPTGPPAPPGQTVLSSGPWAGPAAPEHDPAPAGSAPATGAELPVELAGVSPAGLPLGEPAGAMAAEATSDPERTEFHPAPDPEASTAEGYRPQLGVLVFEDGAAITLNGDVVLGRRPDAHELVAGGQAHPVVIHDPDHVLSGAHAAVRFHGEDVVVVDLDSLNGTHVAAADAREWTRLTPGAPFQMHDGYRMLLGWTVLTFRR